MSSKQNINEQKSLLNIFDNSINYDLKDINNLFYAILVISLIIKFFLSLLSDPIYGSQGEATSVLWGYGLVFFTLMSIYIFEVQKMKNNLFNEIVFTNIFYLFLLILIGITIFLNLSYYIEINLGNVPSEYYKWSFYNYIIVFMLSILIMMKGYNDAERTNNIILIGTLILLFLYLLIVIAQNIIIKNFKVDG